MAKGPDVYKYSDLGLGGTKIPDTNRFNPNTGEWRGNDPDSPLAAWVQQTADGIEDPGMEAKRLTAIALENGKGTPTHEEWLKDHKKWLDGLKDALRIFFGR